MIDLHLHSTYSDGTFSPIELVRMASAKGISAVSITDHDTVDGTEDALREGSTCGVRVIPGVELSVYHDDVHFHLLGYNFDHTFSGLRNGLRLLQESRNERNRQILVKLQNLGIALYESELLAFSAVGQTGRPHIAQLLVKKNVVKTINQAFTDYLRKGACAYTSRFIFTAQEAISLIHDAGGLAVLAHPVQIAQSIDSLRGVLSILVGYGLDGIEVIYPSQNRSFRKKLGLIAAAYGLLETGGSDYHGDIRYGTSIAGGKDVRVPDSVIAEIDELTLKKTKKKKRNGHDYEYHSDR